MAKKEIKTVEELQELGAITQNGADTVNSCLERRSILKDVEDDADI